MKNKILNLHNIIFFLFLMNSTLGHAQQSSDSLLVLTNNDQERNRLVNIAFGEALEKDLLGAISTVDVKELYKKSYSTNSLDDIKGLIGGYNGNIWGQEPLILIDGIPRDASEVHTSEIESVSVLKGASAVVLYGSKAAKGVILITTKRGKVSPLQIKVHANSGVYVPKAYPNYLDAASYMTLYNEAAVNDGISEKYSEELIYNTHSGVNPYRYPNIDFYSSDYLRKVSNKTDVVAEIYGGNERTRYYTNFGMTYNNSLIKYGEHQKNNDLNFRLRSNVDMQLTDWLSATTDVGIVNANNYTGRGDFWGQAASLRPNWVSPLIPLSMFDPNLGTLQTTVDNSNHVIDGQYLLGGSSTVQTNVFADMLAAGYIKYKNRMFQFRQTVGADLTSILKGLSFKSVYSVDYEDSYSEAFRYDYAVYEPTWSATNGDDMVIKLTKFNDDSKSSNEYVGDAAYSQTMTFSSQFDYVRTFNQKHNLNAKLVGWGYQVQSSADGDHDGSSYHYISNVNIGLQVAYNYLNRYYVDLAGNGVHSAKLPEGNRRALSPSLTAGWRISDEAFMNNASFVNNLKLYAAYTVLNQDIDIEEFYMYQGYYNYKGGWYQWRDGAAGGRTTTSERGSNPNLSFIQRKEFQAGLSASLMDNLLAINANYFMQNTNGLLTQGESTIYPTYFKNWSDSFLPYINYNNDRRTGFDFNLNLNDKVGELEYNLGVNGMYFTSEAVQRDEVYQDDYQYRAGKPLDAAWGYISEGFFESQEDIDNHANQTFGDVQPGDLKYQDVNEDGVVDGKDQVNLGHNGWSVSPFNYGVHLTLKWKNLTFFAMGQGVTGAIRFKNNSYYWVKGSSKYSEEVLGRWTEETKNTASYPRLTTSDNSNNFRNSTFWMYKNNRFDLSKMQITYDFTDCFSGSSFINGLTVYVGAENLLTLSKERKVMKTNVGGVPHSRFFNLGLKASF